jgi:hypothetical protein
MAGLLAQASAARYRYGFRRGPQHPVIARLEIEQSILLCRQTYLPTRMPVESIEMIMVSEM